MSAPVHAMPEAWQDVINIFTRISADNPATAERFFDAIEQTFALLGEHPGAGALIEPALPNLPSARSWPITGFKNCLVVYRPVDVGIEIRRVLHGARDIPAALAEVP